jgi:hypothetical protein
MSFGGLYSIYKYDKDEKRYQELSFFDKDGNKLQNFFPTKDRMLNQLLLDYNWGAYDLSPIAYRRGLPDWYLEILKEEHPNWVNDLGVLPFDVSQGTYYDYLELRGWAQGNAREFEDWEEAPIKVEFNDEGEVISGIYPRRNALKDFMAQVDTYLRAYGIYYPAPGEVIIICEMSY